MSKRAIDKAINHRKAKYSGEPIKLTVEEWELDIFVHPLTLRDADIFVQLSQSQTTENFADMLVLLAKDAKGKNLFSADDKELLLTEVDPLVVINTGNAIAEAMAPQIFSGNVDSAGEDLEKNLT